MKQMPVRRRAPSACGPQQSVNVFHRQALDRDSGIPAFLS
jgi:hypothetical protein